MSAVELQEKLAFIRAQHLSARKKKDATALTALGPLLGDVETRLKSKEGLDLLGLYGIVKGHINGLEDCKKHSSDDDSKFQDADSQIKILSEFLPPLMTSAEIVKIAGDFISSYPEELGPRDMGKVINHFKTSYPGKYDGKKLSEIVKDLLQ